MDAFAAAELGGGALAVLVGGAFVTSVISGGIGMAGGIILLTIMLLFLDPLVAIPLHGVVQLVSNGSRAVILRRHIDRRLSGYYAILLLPAAFAGLWLALELDPDATKALIGAFVLAATWRPGWLLLGFHPENARAGMRFTLMGGLIGFLSVVVGATGPLIAPFFLDLGLSRQQIVATSAAFQVMGHAAKVVVFGAVGFAFLDSLALLAQMSVAVVVGTWMGARLLDRIDERTFTWIYKTALTLIALRLLVAGGAKLVGS